MYEWWNGIREEYSKKPSNVSQLPIYDATKAFLRHALVTQDEWQCVCLGLAGDVCADRYKVRAQAFLAVAWVTTATFTHLISSLITRFCIGKA